MFQGCLKTVPWLFDGCLKGYLKDDLRKNISTLFKSKFQASFKGGSRIFQMFLLEVSRVSRESFKVLQEYFKEVCFVSLLLHGTHRGYPSRTGVV